MVECEDSRCSKCGGPLKYYDTVLRTVKHKNGVSEKIKVKRFRCLQCNFTHRILPSYLFPYKLYESEIIFGVLEGIITSDTLGYEDYPCEKTMQRWVTKISK